MPHRAHSSSSIPHSSLCALLRPALQQQGRAPALPSPLTSAHQFRSAFSIAGAELSLCATLTSSPKYQFPQKHLVLSLLSSCHDSQEAQQVSAVAGKHLFPLKVARKVRM